MKINYKLVVFSMLFMLFFTYTAQAQEDGTVIWQDMFDDAANDYLLNNVGWLYFGEDDGLVGQEVSQDGVGDEGRAWIKAGVFNTVVGAGLIQTNGVAAINPEDMDATKEAILIQDSVIAGAMANHVISFTVNFRKMTAVEGGGYPMGTFFLACSGMRRTDQTDAWPDPTEDSTYAVYISPLTNTTAIVKFGGELVVLNPGAWTYLGQSTEFEYEQNVNYDVKFYLNGNDYKVKVWEHSDDPTDEPDEYLIEATDTDPWKRGVWTVMTILGDPIGDGNGDEIYLDNVVLKQLGASAIDEEPSINAPAVFALKNNYPNPFNPTTTIEYSLDKADDVTINIYSVTGQLVRTLTNESMSAGTHRVTFNGLDNNGNSLSSGIYFYTLQNSVQSITKKMILMK